jgi:farnesyl diphosphate synthase
MGPLSFLPPAVQVLAVPVGIVALAGIRSANKLEDAVHAFWALELQDQLNLLCVLFGVVFAAVAVSHTHLSLLPALGSTSTLTSRAAARTDYPLLEMSQVQTDLEKFQALYPFLRDELLEQMKASEMPPAAVEWCRQMVDYNVPGGKLNRGTTVVAVLRALQKNQRPLTPVQIARAGVCGWSIELLQAFFLVADDVMDDSQTRRGQPCWYKNSDVKLIAINDSFLLESFVFSLLKAHFGNEPYFPDMVQLLLDVIQKTEYGQLLDLTTASASGEGKVDLDRFTMEQYKLIVKYKTAYYSFYLPVALGMMMSGRHHNKEAYEVAQRICCAMGEYFQVQDDYLDCFGDPAHIGKVGTDIQDNKCSWLVVTALQKCKATPKQRQILQDNYGQWNDGKVQKVKQLYRELDLMSEFERYEENSYAAIQGELDRLPPNVPRAVFEVLLKKIYKRSM